MEQQQQKLAKKNSEWHYCGLNRENIRSPDCLMTTRIHSRTDSSICGNIESMNARFNSIQENYPNHFGLRTMLIRKDNNDNINA